MSKPEQIVTVKGGLVHESSKVVELSLEELQNYISYGVELSGEPIMSQLIDENGDGKSDLLLIHNENGFGHQLDLNIFESSGLNDSQEVKKTQAELWHKTTGKFKEGRYVGGGNFSRFDSLRVPEGFMDHAYFIKYEGPGWESDKVGYRLYLDWRNAIDVFGKKIEEPVLQNVGMDGYESYHHMQEWGMDVLKVGSSLGIGSTAWWTGESALRVEKTDSVICRILSDGNIRSQVQVWYYGWDLNGKKVNVNSIKSIDSGSRMTREKLLSDRPVGQFCTGIRKDKKSELIELKSNNGSWHCIATWGAQSLNADNLGLAVLYPASQNPIVSEDKNSHVVFFDRELKELEYYFLAAWELEKDGLKSQDDFVTYLKQELNKLEAPLRIQY